MQGMWLSVTVSIEFSSSITGTLFSLISHFFVWMVLLFPVLFFLYYIYLSFFESVWWSRLSWVACQSIYICSREDCDIENPIFPLDVKTKNDRVSSPPIIRLYIFAAIFLCLLFLSTRSYFFQSPAIDLWFAYPCSIICLLFSQKNLFMFPEIILQFFFTFFLIIPPQFNPQTHKKKIFKTLEIAPVYLRRLFLS